jgi:hypothetical protein
VSGYEWDRPYVKRCGELCRLAISSAENATFLNSHYEMFTPLLLLLYAHAAHRDDQIQQLLFPVCVPSAPTVQVRGAKAV